MASDMPLQDEPPPDLSLEEIIFSCDICQATVSEVYATKEQHAGFHSGSPQDSGNGIVAKFWIGECSHVFCGRHLEGGGVAFHSKDSAPSASCPVCPRNLPASRSQEIFAIRGLNPGEYDDIIPESWLRCPPTRLESQDVEMDALRFQYQRLASYSRKVNKAWKTAERNRQNMESTLSNERKHWRTREAEIKEALRTRDALIEDRDAKLKKWDGRKEVINHYMGIVGPMAKEIADMRTLLVELGYQVPESNYSYRPKMMAEIVRADERAHQTDSSATLVDSNVRTSPAFRKRKANNNAYADSQEQGFDEPRPQLMNDKAMMMPPPLLKTRSTRHSGKSARHAMPQLALQRQDLSLQSGVQSRQQYGDPQTQQPHLQQPQSGRYSHLAIPLSREQPSRHLQQTFPLSRQNLSSAGDYPRPPSQSPIHLYENPSWQNQPLPNATASPPRGLQALDRSQNLQLHPAHQPLRFQDSLLDSSNGLINRPSQYGHLPSQQFLAQKKVHGGAERSFNAAGKWRGGTAMVPFGGPNVSRPSQPQSVQSQQIERPVADSPLYRHSGRTYAEHTGTTTLGSEFRAQEMSTSPQRQTGLLAQPPRRRTSQRAHISTVQSNGYLQSQPSAPSEPAYHDAAYGTLAQQSGEDPLGEMEGFHIPPPPSQVATRTLLKGDGQYRLSTPAYRQHPGPPTGSSVVSPFFGEPLRRQPEEIQRESRGRFSYAAPTSLVRDGVVDHYQGNDGVLPPRSSHTRTNRGLPARGLSFAPYGTAGNSSSISTFARGSQPTSSATGARAPQQARPRARMSLPSAPGSSRMTARAGIGAARGSLNEPRSLFSGAGPTRRSIRR